MKYRATASQGTERLIGTSLTPESGKVIRMALTLTRALGARIRLLHALPLKPWRVWLEKHMRTWLLLELVRSQGHLIDSSAPRRTV